MRKKKIIRHYCGVCKKRLLPYNVKTKFYLKGFCKECWHKIYDKKILDEYKRIITENSIGDSIEFLAKKYDLNWEHIISILGKNGVGTGRFCYSCKNFKPEEEFIKFKPFNKCKDCYEEYKISFKNIMNKSSILEEKIVETNNSSIIIDTDTAFPISSPNDKLFEDNESYIKLKKKNKRKELEEEYKLTEDVFGNYSGRLHQNE